MNYVILLLVIKMNENFKENISDYLKSENNLAKKVLLYRLYYNDSYNQDNTLPIMVRLSSSISTIADEIKNLNQKNDSYFQNKEIINYIAMYFEILNNNINSYDRKNKKQMDSIIQTCTILESLLKLPLSFPEVRNDTINSLMNSNKNYKNKNL